MLKSLKKNASTKTIKNDEFVKTKIDFKLHNELIYHSENRRLCILVTMKQEIFKLIHE